MPEDQAPSISQLGTLEQPSALVASSFGRYRLLQRLGEGGMGEIWLAEQTEPVHRQVAVKVIKAGMDSAQVIARFEAERQALALMDHPAIATVFDGGTTPQGRPYFAMEYVKGEPITSYCDRHRLSTPERLELFTQVCEGVQHAHQKGIIHRDLKPSNVLVTIQDDHPVPKIIDFGVAKAMTQHLTERSLFTELGVLIGTPEYMSPEQAEMGGLDIDTRTDIYALGVLLYELLTGALPFDREDLRKAGLAEVQRIIREKEPARPSTRITQPGPASSEAAKNRHTGPRGLVGELRGDLDWITMRALEKDRTRRYQTANALTADVRRHLNSEPVSAGPPSTVYRAGKFVRRHRFGVAVAATGVVLLLAFGVAMAAQSRRTALERDRANREAETAKRTAAFLVGLFEASQPSEATANSITAREILDKGADTISHELQGQPETRATLMTTMGQAYQSLGLYKEAERLQQGALDLLQANGQPGPGGAQIKVLLADALASQARFVEAERLYLDALAVLRESRSPEAPSVANALFQLADVLRKQGKLTEGEAIARESLALYRSLPEAPAAAFARAVGAVGLFLFDKADYTGAERSFEEAADLMRRALGGGHPQTLKWVKNLATVWMLLGRYERAEAAFRDIVAAERKSLGPDHPRLATSLNNLGAVLFFERKYEEAIAVYGDALVIVRKVLGAGHPDVAWPLKNLGQALTVQGKYDQAERHLREALLIEQKALGSDHPSVGMTMSFLSDALRGSGEFREAESFAREALAINTKKLGPDHPRTKEARGALGRAMAKQRRWTEAEPLLLEYAAALEAKSGVEGDFAAVAQEIVGMYEAWGKPEKAKEWRAKLAAQPKPGATGPAK